MPLMATQFMHGNCRAGVSRSRRPAGPLPCRRKRRCRVFAPSNARRVLASAPAPDGSLLIEHSTGAFLTFVDASRHLSAANYNAFLSSRRYLGALWNSIVVTLVSTAIAATIGVALAYLAARFEVPGGTRLVLTLVAIASISPSFLGAYAWRLLFSSNGIVANFFGLEGSIVGTHGVIWVLIWLNFPIVFLLAYDAFTGADEALREAAMSVGADRMRSFLKIELPLAVPGILTGLYLAAMAAFTDFGTPSIISIDINILPVIIYRDFMGEIGSNPSMASTGSMIMVLISTFLLAAQRAYLATLAFASVAGRRSVPRKPSVRMRVTIIVALWGTLFIAFVPHITVLVTSVSRVAQRHSDCRRYACELPQALRTALLHDRGQSSSCLLPQRCSTSFSASGSHTLSFASGIEYSPTPSTPL